jgi:hypothetical protein
MSIYRANEKSGRVARGGHKLTCCEISELVRSTRKGVHVHCLVVTDFLEQKCITQKKRYKKDANVEAPPVVKW